MNGLKLVSSTHPPWEVLLSVFGVGRRCLRMLSSILFHEFFPSLLTPKSH